MEGAVLLYVHLWPFILWPFGISLPRLGKLYQEKSCNPAFSAAQPTPNLKMDVASGLMSYIFSSGRDIGRAF
jgi:hypothetical protein